MHSNADKSMGFDPEKPANFIAGKAVYGRIIDQQTRCIHYHSSVDIIAIKFRCCDKYYPCYECHEETADHEAQQWLKEERYVKAILCGACGHELTIEEYFSCENRCPECESLFNPNCSKHYRFYFEF